MRAGKFAGARCPRGGRLPPGARLARPHSRRATSPPPGPSRSRNAPAGASSGRDSTNADAAGAPPATEAASSTAAAEAIIEASSARRPPPVVRLGRSWWGRDLNFFPPLGHCAMDDFYLPAAPPAHLTDYALRVLAEKRVVGSPMRSHTYIRQGALATGARRPTHTFCAFTYSTPRAMRPPR